MRLATWNVNSVRTRVDRVTAFLEREDIDVLAMQEIKCRPEQFPRIPFEAAGYELAVHGLDQWNGVAIASRVGLADVVTDGERNSNYIIPGVFDSRVVDRVSRAVVEHVTRSSYRS